MSEPKSYLDRAKKWIKETDDLAIEQLEAVIEQFSCRLQDLKMLKHNNIETIADLQATIEYLNVCAIKIAGEDLKEATEVNEVSEFTTYTFDPRSLVNYTIQEKENMDRNVSVIHDLIKKGMIRRGF